LIEISLASKRDYANRHYYALHTEKNEIQHVQELTKQLGATFEGRVGELANYFWISFPPEYIPPLKHSNLTKRDHLDYKIYPQIPSKRLFKRPYIDVGDWVPNATQPGLEEYRGFQRMKNYLDINNPGFNFQWHHVNVPPKIGL
jgi:hypothetical protein